MALSRRVGSLGGLPALPSISTSSYKGYSPFPGYISEPKKVGLTKGQQFINTLLRFMGSEDIPVVARGLFQATEGSKGPFSAYANVTAQPGANEQRNLVGEMMRLQAIQKELNKSDLKTGGESMARAMLGLALSTLGNVQPGTEQDITARSRGNWIRFISELNTLAGEGILGQSLLRALLPTQLRPLPGQLVGTQSGYSIQPNPQWFVG